jgi:predicted nucleotidyltransferase
VRFSKATVICGVPAPKLRDLFRYCRRWREIISSEIIAEQLGIPPPQANDVLRCLVHDGFVERSTQQSESVETWELTDAARRITKANFTPRITREKADELVRKLRQQVDVVNDNGEYLYTIEYVLVFGSYADLTQMELGDIDVAVGMKIRPEHQKVDLLNYAYRRGARSMAEAISLPEREVIKVLRAGSRAFDFTQPIDGAVINAALAGTILVVYQHPTAPDPLTMLRACAEG